MTALATVADVKRVMQLDTLADPIADPALSEAVDVATIHVTDYLKADWTLSGAGLQTEKYYDRPEDAMIPVPLRGAIIQQVRFYRTPTATAYVGVVETDYTVEDDRHIRFHPTFFDIPFEGSVAQHLPENLARIEVDYTPPSAVPKNIRDAVAITAGALWKRVPANLGPYKSESLGDYTYTLATREKGQLAVIPDEAAALLRPWRRRSSMVT